MVFLQYFRCRWHPSYQIWQDRIWLKHPTPWYEDWQIGKNKKLASLSTLTLCQPWLPPSLSTRCAPPPPSTAESCLSRLPSTNNRCWPSSPWPPRPQTAPEYSGLPPWSSPNRSSLLSRTSRARASDGDPSSTSSSSSSFSSSSQLSSTSLLSCPGNLPACVWDHPPISASPPSPCLPLRLSSHWSDAKVFLPLFALSMNWAGRQVFVNQYIPSKNTLFISAWKPRTMRTSRQRWRWWSLCGFSPPISCFKCPPFSGGQSLVIITLLSQTLGNLKHYHQITTSKIFHRLRPGVFSPSSLFGIDWQRYLMLKMTQECPLFRSTSS